MHMIQMRTLAASPLGVLDRDRNYSVGRGAEDDGTPRVPEKLAQELIDGGFAVSQTLKPSGERKQK